MWTPYLYIVGPPGVVAQLTSALATLLRSSDCDLLSTKRVPSHNSGRGCDRSYNIFIYRCSAMLIYCNYVFYIFSLSKYPREKRFPFKKLNY